MAREIKSVGIVGLGTMGAGIVEVFAREGFTVIGLEISDDAVERGRGHLEGSTARAAKRGKLSEEDRAALLGRVTLTTSYDDLSGCDLVIEAVPELMKLKSIVFGELDRVAKPGAILATNTSSLSVTEIAMTTSRPADVIGMHFFNPAPVMKLVEVVSSVATDPEATDAVVALARQIGKTPVAVRDRAGFVANYLLFGYLNRAARMVGSGYVGRDAIDTAVKLGIGLPMGPLELLDMIGLDTAVEILDTMHAQTGDPLHVPAPLLTQHVVLGQLGRKTGRGFYTYEGGKAVDAAPADAAVPPGAPSVTRLGIAGMNSHADGLAALFAKLGVEIVRADADASAFKGCDVVLISLATEVGAEAAFIGELAGVLAADATVLTSGPRTDITAVAAASGLGERLVGFHILEPTKRGQLVEIISGLGSASTEVGARTLEVARDLAARLELASVEVEDRPGQVIGALLFPHINDAIRMVDEGYATFDDVDHALTLGCGYPFGLVVAADLLGLDRVLEMQEQLYASEGQPGLAPAPLLRRHVAAGRLGRSTGRGFRDLTAASAEG